MGPARKGAAGASLRDPFAVGEGKFWVKMGMDRSGPGLGPGPMALRPILGVMGRLISPKCYGLDGPFGIMGRPKYFSIILNHEYY